MATKPVVVFDEIHQLRDPARLLKIRADMFPFVKILATGSSTLAAARKFHDTLVGRKRAVHLTPVTWDELPAFGTTLDQRLLHGGLPQALLADTKKPSLYREWMDSVFARDLQRLFGLRDMNRFNALFEYLLRQSGGQFEVTRTASALGVSRPTIESHVQALEITHAVTVVRPFSAPDSIVALLSRREVRTESEQLKRVIDSYHDRRTAYQFVTHPVGVKRDFYVDNDNTEDGTWDAVWDVATRIDSLGWRPRGHRLPLPA